MKDPHASAVVACFLLQEGANILLQNNIGATPIEVCSPEVATVVMTFKDTLSAKTYDEIISRLQFFMYPSLKA